MNSAAHSNQPSSDDPTVLANDADEPGSVLVRLMEECLVKLEAGESVDRDDLVAEHPELASQLDACLASLQFIHRAVQPTEGVPARLADFRIIREIGRGGMGVVYEAEQISLKRPVALKVLRFGAVADPEAMQRFQREAETIASLHHTNIVPVFAVGVEKSIHYYAMQLIEGRCLREIVQDTAKQPVPDKTIASWGLQAAEALAHAHERNVVHRDIKPSNLILGTDGRIWLTDFGLAKRLDDVTLSLCGALLGTPRYMSPEQASSMRHPVDHRTDIYSLGATLYELVTGRPLFESESPHVVISQILTIEPKPPREFVRGVSRDLETIILKCLCKDASQRYQSARELADDLRAFEEGRAIKARRATIFEQAGRWIRRNRKLLAATATTVAVTTVFVIGLSSWWQQQTALRNGTLTLKTKEGPLTAEVLTSKGEPAIPSFTVPNEQPVAIPEGEYRLRISGRGGLSKTALVTLKAGQSQELDVEINHPDFHPAIPLGSMTGYEFIDFGDGPDLVVLPDSPNPPDNLEKSNGVDPRMLRRISGRTGKDIWSLDISQKSEALKALLPTDQIQSLWWTSTVFGWKLASHPPLRALRPLLDLDSDGVPDLVWRHHQGFSLFAVSGKTGKPLWWHYSPTTASGARSQFEEIGIAEVRQADGTLLPVIVFTEVGNGTDGKPAFARVTAINARDKGSLWSTDLAAASSKMAIAKFHEGSDLAVVINQGQVLTFDLTNGKPVGQALRLDQADDPTKASYSSPTVVDLDNDRQPEVMLKKLEVSGQPYGVRVVSLSATGPETNNKRPNWFVPFASQEPEKNRIEVQDLNNDGVQEVVLMSNRSEFDCRVLDGRNGEELWRRRRPSNFFNGRHSPAVVGDDLDGDGWREVFVLSVEPDNPNGFIDKPHSLFADCFSGKDGKSLWWNRTSIPGKPNAFLHPFAVEPRWWKHGIDGQPGLLVTIFLETKFPTAQGLVYTVAARNGQFQEFGMELAQPEPIDLNRDGFDELTVVRLTDTESHAHQLNQMPGELRILQSENPIGWRRFGTWRPLMDLDGDGIKELWQPNHRYGSRLPIISGRDGTRIQEWAVDHETSDLIPLTEPRLDLDKDGLPEMLGLDQQWNHHVDDGTSPPVSAPIGVTLVSPKNQRALWTGPSVPLPKWEGFRWMTRQTGTTELRDLDGDKKLEVVVPYYWQVQQEHRPPAPGRCQYCLAILDAYSGRLKWSTVLMEDQQDEHLLWYSPTEWMQPIQFGDLDGDGVQDILMSLAAAPWHKRWQREMVVQAISGRDGHLLWPEIRAQFHEPKQGIENLMQVSLANVDGKPGDEVVRLDFRSSKPQINGEPWEGEWALDVLDGRTGKPIFANRWPGKMHPHATVSELQRLVTIRRPQTNAILVMKAKFDPRVQTNENVDWLLAIPKEVASTGDKVRELELVETRETKREDHVWKVDLNADGIDELVFWRVGKDYEGPAELVVGRGLNNELWKQTIPRSRSYSQPKLKLLDTGKALLVSVGESNLVLSADGVLLSQFITPKDAGTDLVLGVADWTDRWSAGKAPRVIVQEGSQIRSDLILPVDDHGRAQPMSQTEKIGVSNRPDPRIARRLPWARDWVSIAATSAMIGASLMIWLFFIAPFSLIRWGWRERKQTWPLVVASIGTAAWLFGVWQIVNMVRPGITSGSRVSPELGLFLLIGLPLALAPSIFIRWVRAGNHKPFIRMLVTAILVSLGLAALLIWFDIRSMHTAEHYVSDGWYQIILPGTCIGIWLALVLRWIWQAILKASQRMLRPKTT